MARTRALAIVMFLASTAPADDLPADVLLVAHTIQANHKLLMRLPQYTCLETISRNRPSRNRHKAQKQDTVQVDVGVGDVDEIYSWPGDAAFSSKDLSSLVGHGMLVTGLFKSFAANIFVNESALVKAAGSTIINGKKAFHFTYTIPSLQGKWEVNWLGTRGLVGERGEFWVDESDLTLVRLDVVATDIPYNIFLRSFNVTIQYRLLSPGAGLGVLIPADAALKAVERDGTVKEEAVDFSHCRAFEAESNLVATDSPEAALKNAISRFEAKREVLPGGLVFSITLETPLQVDKTIVGERVSALLEHAVKTPSHDLIPKGATLTGRVREFGRLDDPPDSFVVGLEFDELTWPGHSAAFLASLFSLEPIPGVELKLSSERQTGFHSGNIQTDRTSSESFAPIAIPGVASFFLKGTSTSLPKGFQMTWRTEELPHP